MTLLQAGLSLGGGSKSSNLLESKGNVRSAQSNAKLVEEVESSQKGEQQGKNTPIETSAAGYVDCTSQLHAVSRSGITWCNASAQNLECCSL